MPEPTNQLTLTDAVIRNATLPPGKAQHYLHDGPRLAHACHRRTDLGLPFHQAGGERDPAQDPRRVAET
jgi:hypothetical protein